MSLAAMLRDNMLSPQTVTPHYLQLRLLSSMQARITSLIVSTCRRSLAAVACVLMLMMAVIPADLTSNVGSTRAGQVEILATGGGSDSTPLHSDGLPCHSAHHICGKVTPLPPTLVAGSPAVRRPAFTPVWTPARVLLSGVTELPTRPPRA